MLREDDDATTRFEPCSASLWIVFPAATGADQIILSALMLKRPTFPTSEAAQTSNPSITKAVVKP
jgi:hypothetical protein